MHHPTDQELIEHPPYTSKAEAMADIKSHAHSPTSVGHVLRRLSNTNSSIWPDPEARHAPR